MLPRIVTMSRIHAHDAHRIAKSFSWNSGPTCEVREHGINGFHEHDLCADLGTVGLAAKLQTTSGKDCNLLQSYAHTCHRISYQCPYHAHPLTTSHHIILAPLLRPEDPETALILFVSWRAVSSCFEYVPMVGRFLDCELLHEAGNKEKKVASEK